MLTVRFNSSTPATTQKHEATASPNAFQTAIKRVVRRVDLSSLGKTLPDSVNSGHSKIISVCSGVSLADFLNEQSRSSVQNTDDLSDITMGSEFNGPRRSVFNFDYKTKYRPGPQASDSAASPVFHLNNANRSKPIPVPSRSMANPGRPLNEPHCDLPGSLSSASSKSVNSPTRHVMPFELDL